MTSFIDLSGASGAHYRFRAWSDAGQTPMAGNFVVAELGAGGQIQLLLIGVIEDLSKVPTHVTAAGFGDKPVFVRLNVARQTREHEHEDLAARYSSARMLDLSA